MWMLNTVKNELADASIVSPSSEQAKLVERDQKMCQQFLPSGGHH